MELSDLSQQIARLSPGDLLELVDHHGQRWCAEIVADPRLADGCVIGNKFYPCVPVAEQIRRPRCKRRHPRNSVIMAMLCFSELK